jgi:hypothetical protein
MLNRLETLRDIRRQHGPREAKNCPNCRSGGSTMSPLVWRCRLNTTLLNHTEAPCVAAMIQHLSLALIYYVLHQS